MSSLKTVIQKIDELMNLVSRLNAEDRRKMGQHKFIAAARKRLGEAQVVVSGIISQAQLPEEEEQEAKKVAQYLLEDELQFAIRTPAKWRSGEIPTTAPAQLPHEKPQRGRKDLLPSEWQCRKFLYNYVPPVNEMSKPYWDTIQRNIPQAMVDFCNNLLQANANCFLKVVVEPGYKERVEVLAQFCSNQKLYDMLVHWINI